MMGEEREEWEKERKKREKDREEENAAMGAWQQESSDKYGEENVVTKMQQHDGSEGKW